MDTKEIQINSYSDLLTEAIQNSWNNTSSEAFIGALAEHLELLVNKLIQYGDEQAEHLATAPPYKSLEYKDSLIFHFHWVEAAKSFLIMWRNVLFENQKAAILHLDDLLNEEQKLLLKKDSENSLYAASQELMQSNDKLIAKLKKQNNGLEQQLEQWHKQDIAWPVYKQQFERLKQQAAELKGQYLKLKDIHQIISTIKKLSLDTIRACEEEVVVLQKLAKESIAFINENINGSTGKIPIYLENTEHKISFHEYNQQFNRNLEGLIVQLVEETDISLETQAGILQKTNINFKKGIAQWMDSEILPLLMEIWELSSNTSNNLKMALINIRNRAILLHNDNKDGQNSSLGIEDLCQPLHTFLQQSDDFEQSTLQLDQLIHHRIEKNFQLSNIFQANTSFLNIENQSTLTQLRSNQNELLKKAQVWFKEQRRKVDNWLSVVQAEDTLSTSEKIVRYLESRLAEKHNQSYNGIFLTQGYIGESFWVGREIELKRMATLIEQWQQGYRGSVLLTAKRFAGKSLFGDIISNRFFAQNTLRLVPNSSIQLSGRSFNTSYDLGQALEFINKYRANQKILVWLDDLELWHDQSISLSKNVEQLKQHIDKHFSHVFYIVSLGPHLKKQLAKSHDLERSFQAEINLDYMDLAAVHKAILIRHGATHKRLVDKMGKGIQPQAFEQMTKQIYRYAKANIGESLSLWSANITPNNEEEVHFSLDHSYVLPDFLEADLALVLRVLLLEKRTNEYRLRKRFGPAFNAKYAEALLRLQSTGVIKRQLDGWLEINPVAVNDIMEQLEQEGYL